MDFLPAIKKIALNEFKLAGSLSLSICKIFYKKRGFWNELFKLLKCNSTLLNYRKNCWRRYFFRNAILIKFKFVIYNIEFTCRGELNQFFLSQKMIQHKIIYLFPTIRFKQQSGSKMPVTFSQHKPNIHQPLDLTPIRLPILSSN